MRHKKLETVFNILYIALAANTEYHIKINNSFNYIQTLKST